MKHSDEVVLPRITDAVNLRHGWDPLADDTLEALTKLAEENRDHVSMRLLVAEVWRLRAAEEVLRALVREALEGYEGRDQYEAWQERARAAVKEPTK